MVPGTAGAVLALLHGVAYHPGMKHPLVAWFSRFASRLRFPWLVALTGGILVVDLFVPDFIPFVDEILLALATMVLAGFRNKPVPGEEDPGVEADDAGVGAARENGRES